MRVNLTSLTLVAALLISGNQALTAPTIAECPVLKPRSAPATNVADLRPDDIKVVAALGDR
jgi:phospholipase B1